MSCTLRRDTTIPTYRNEKAWTCDTCGAVMIAARKPQCRLKMLPEVEARRAAAEAEADQLDLDHKEQR